MADCQYFKQTRLSGPVIQLLGGGSTQAIADVSWCAHQSSPVSERIATKTIGGEKKLTCGGDLSRCQIPAQNR